MKREGGGVRRTAHAENNEVDWTEYDWQVVQQDWLIVNDICIVYLATELELHLNS